MRDPTHSLTVRLGGIFNKPRARTQLRRVQEVCGPIGRERERARGKWVWVREARATLIEAARRVLRVCVCAVW